MNTFSVTHLWSLTPYKKNYIITGIVLLLVMVTVMTDYAEAGFRQSDFYFSESLLFSSFWVLFLPFLYLQVNITKFIKPFSVTLALIPLWMAIHLLVYPALVWLLSALFYPHTFSYTQTLGFSLPQYFIVLLLAYSIPPFISRINRVKAPAPIHTIEPPVMPLTKTYIHTICVTTANGSRVIINTSDILYIAASSPYIQLHLAHKKMVHNETLKNLEGLLNPVQFIRVHKSHIVNLHQVTAYKSRLNGDYDLTLTNGDILRLSRNYAPAFKAAFQTGHRVSQ
jgi:two-component system response regulator LytT